jgi:uncharacterized protein
MSLSSPAASASDISPSSSAPRIDGLIVAGAATFLVLGAVLIGQAVSLRQALLLLIGAALGLALYHSSFGFTGGWRAFVTERRAAGLRAQMLMIGIATVFIIPLLSLGTIGGQALGGALGPIGVSLVVGALMFGFGMQLGGGCASGTLFSAGGGNVRMLVTLVFFITGAVIGTAHLPWWASLPQIGVVLPAERIGVWPMVLLQVAGLALVALVATWCEKRRYGHVSYFADTSNDSRPLALRLIRGPWPLGWGAVILGVLSVVTFVVAGHPWSVTFAFNLWGAKLLTVLGVDVASWEYWTWPMPAQALRAPIIAETTSVLDFGLILGALLAAGLAGRFKPDVRIPLRSLAGAVVGGVLMGYGARLAFGCNIGAFLGGISSGSLHGWVWFAAAFVGSLGGIKARPLFGLGR